MQATIQRRYLQNAEYVFKTLQNVLDENYDVKEIDEVIKYVKVSSGMSWLSFGETLEITVFPDNDNSIVKINSKPTIIWNVTNNMKQKTKEIFDLLDENL